MHPLIQLLVVISVMIGIYVCLILMMRFISKNKLLNFKGLLLASLSLGGIFGTASFVLILISKKFQDWSLVRMLMYAGEIFLWVFFGGLILIAVAFRRSQNFVQRNKQKIPEK